MYTFIHILNTMSQSLFIVLLCSVMCRVLDTEVEYQATKAEAERAERLATEVRGESLSIYSDVKLLTIPDIDTQKLYDQASEIKSDVSISDGRSLN